MSAEIEAIDALVIIGTLVVVWGAVAALFVSQERATRRDLAGIRGDIAEIRSEIGAAPAIVAAATRKIQEGEPGTESGS